MNRYPGMDALYEEYDAKKGEIRRKLLEFQTVPAENYFYELIFCLLTPQSSAANAFEVQKRLEEGDFRRTGFNRAGSASAGCGSTGGISMDTVVFA